VQLLLLLRDAMVDVRGLEPLTSSSRMTGGSVRSRLPAPVANALAEVHLNASRASRKDIPNLARDACQRTSTQKANVSIISSDKASPSPPSMS
jgi:hypothetical protein